MNKITKRIVAGVSAAALLVSAVGVDQLADLFMKTSYAIYNSKTARSTGFGNLEQDTDGDNYNTGYGLHTNKTATALDDGRTFNVNLESWYVGENPVDVATILDASGSMAWTVDTLKPLVIDYKCFGDYEKANGVTIDDIGDLQEIQEDNKGYLPQDIVDCILKPKNTDDSKLSYAGYKYYVYEDRSSVSEFVPLGYWDGGKTAEKFSPIGYYPFNGSLENSMGGTATYIKQAATGGEFDKNSTATITPQAVFSDGYLDLSETDQNGNLIIDLCGRFDVEEDITISFDLNCKQLSSTKTPQTPIIYLGDGTNSNYLALMRGRCHDNGAGAQNHLYIYDSGADDNTNKLKPTGTTTADNKALDGNYSPSCTLTISKGSAGNYDVTLKVGTKTFNYVTNYVNLDSSKLYLVVGGDEILPKGSLLNKGQTEEVIDPENLKGDSDKNVSIKNLKISGSNGSDTISETFALNNAAGLTGNSGTVVKYYQQKEIGSSAISFDEQETVYAEPEYSDKALNLTQTAKLGAVLLDVAPKSSSFTLSFKVKKADDDSKPKPEANILYMGSMDTSQDYYRIFRDDDSSASRFRMRKGATSTTNYVDINSVFSNQDIKTITIVFDGKKVTQYSNGSIDTTYNSKPDDLDSELTNLSLILGGLFDSTYNGSDILIDDLYVFDKALDADEVTALFKNIGNTEFAILPSALTTGCKGYHATKSGTTDDIAQISKSLAQNPVDEERRGWYYVNSHSNWADISGCLESGKQYVGIVKEEENGEDYYDHFDVATTPNSSYDFTGGDNKDDEKYKAPDNERSIRFYVDKDGHLRCFAHAGGTSEENDPRTFCSVVYEKGYNDDDKSEQITKYEALNDALNGFYLQLATESDLSNSAIVRFSTHNLLKNTTTEEAAKKVLKELIIKDWTNWSDYYQKLPASEKTGKTKEQLEKLKEGYMNDLLIPADGETSLGVGGSAPDTGEYPYVMTGGTYTWTGLKAFYDNMVNKDATDASQTTKDIANDARDKYLIIFTDGRDNNVGTNDNKHVHVQSDDKVEIDGKEQQPYKNCIGNFAPSYDGKQQELSNDSELAKAWADKLKDEGYTIFCVMMAAGSISPTTNETEYQKAKEFVTSLAGEKADDPYAADYVSVIGAGAGEGTVDNVSEAFNNILKQIQQPRADYTVQDYIDPRFDLVDKDGNLYKLGAGGKITVTKDGEAVTGLKYSDGSTFTNGNAVGNIIDSIDEGTTATGLAYTPQESFMVNRTSSTDMNGDGVGTGYLYYDDVKDMYYLRWTKQIIPMENRSFDTDKLDDYVDGKPKYLDVWSATIRLKAKDDFIGGNNILTNGNEAGENLVYSDATIENMDKNPELYFTEDELAKYETIEGSGEYNVPYRVKLCRLSGTDRKINAVDAGGVSQAVYGNGIDIPSSGFPRTTVNVRLLKLDAKNLNDVIYMGEVVSPTMMLADLENGYMTGSYYLQYLERYAYRVYGDEAGKMPLIELLNKWLKIDDKNQEKKTFTIPYIYLPDPEYNADGTLAKEDGKVKLQNSTGASWDGTDIDFADLNLRDVTGFITYTWKREDVDINGDGTVDKGDRESQQVVTDAAGNEIYDITKDYVAKNTKQIKYNLQLKFTPLKETAAELKDFTLDTNFINADSTGKGGDKFFNIVSGEFNDTSVTAWTINYGREDYLKAIIQETRTYEPHVMYDTTNNKWKLIEEADKTTALETYEKDDQTTVDKVKNTVTDHGVYDWTPDYKPASGNAQLEGGTAVDDVKNIKGFYTDTPDNVKMLNAGGKEITDDEGAIKAGSTAPVSLAANTTYTKDVVNAALALELFVDGKYLKSNMPLNPTGTKKTFEFIATRYYDDPIDPPPYDKEHSIGADTDLTNGQKYQLTFKVDELPENPQSNEIYKVWAVLDSVQVENASSGYESITTDGYADENALPIGTYVIDTDNNNLGESEIFKIAEEDTGAGTPALYFQYLKIDNDKNSFTYDKFPKSVYEESDTAAESTKDGDYLILNDKTDNSKANIAENNRVKEKDPDKQTVTFYFGTVKDDTASGKKGVNRIEDKDKDYAKDRLGIIMLSASTNSLAITKEVKNTNAEDNKNHEWDFTVTIETDDSEWAGTHAGGDLDYTLYNFEGGTWVADTTTHNAKYTITEAGGKYTLTITGVKVKHNQKAVFSGLPEGTWKVTEDLGGVFCTPHNDQFTYGEDEWQYNRADSTRADIDLTPASQVNYINEFPYELPSAGGSGTVRYILLGTLLTALGALLFAVLYYDRKKARR